MMGTHQAIFILFLYAAFSCSQAATLVAADKTLTLREAYSPTALKQGLMHVTDLGTDSGMVFVFPRSQIVRFWMKDTPLSLDILFVDANHRVQHIHKNAVPYSETTIVWDKPIKWVIELKAGLVDQLKLQVGHDIILNIPNAISNLGT